LKDVDSIVFTRMLRKDGRTEGRTVDHRVKFLGEGICHALRCPCLYFIVLIRVILVWHVNLEYFYSLV
jgi:hypothetical protein